MSFLVRQHMASVNIITLEHMKKMMNNPIFRNIGHFDNAMDLASFEDLEGMNIDDIKHHKVFSSEQQVASLESWWSLEAC